jgi:zinc/manganese transport system substrate-binding protein
MTFKYLLCCFLVSFPASAAIKVVATTPDIAWLAQRIGGKEVEVKALAKPRDDYHFLDARPDFILAVNRAQVVCRVGLELEIGWLPKILERAANTKVMGGGAGDCDPSRWVSVEEKPGGKIDRSLGDVHASGNPHYWLSPLEMAKAALEVEAKLAAADPGKAAEFAGNRAKLEQELKSLHARIKEKLRPLAGKKVIEYHKDFVYFLRDYGLTASGSIEEIPGVSPSAARLGKVALESKKAGVALAFASTHGPRSALDKFRELSGIPVLVLPTSLDDPSGADAFEKWQNALAEKILRAN